MNANHGRDNLPAFAACNRDLSHTMTKTIPYDLTIPPAGFVQDDFSVTSRSPRVSVTQHVSSLNGRFARLMHDGSSTQRSMSRPNTSPSHLTEPDLMSAHT